MFRIKILSDFSAAHFLRGYKGKCEALHGHNWKVEVAVSCSELNELGMVMDFKELKSLTNPVLEELDHKQINELDYFKEYNPSSEEIARYIFDRLQPEIAQKNCRLEEIRIWETENSCAIYRG